MLRMRFADFSRATRSQTLPRPTSRTPTILSTARGLLAAMTPTIDRRGLTLLGITLANLSEGPHQLTLPFDRSTALDLTLDQIRDRYGAESITRAVLLGRSRDMAMPLLPD